MNFDNLMLYRDPENGSLIRDICLLFKDGKKEDVYSAGAKLLSLSNDLGFEGNLWHDHLAWFIANNENSFSMRDEDRRKGKPA